MLHQTPFLHAKFLLAKLAAVLYLFAPLNLTAADGPLLICIAGEVFQTKRTAVEPFLRAEKIDANQFLVGVQKMAQVSPGTATISALPAVTARSGQRAVTKGKEVTLEVEAVIGPGGQSVSLNAVLKLGEKQLTTANTITKFGDTIFLGTLDGSTPESVQVVFIRVLRQ